MQRLLSGRPIDGYDLRWLGSRNPPLITPQFTHVAIHYWADVTLRRESSGASPAGSTIRDGLASSGQSRTAGIADGAVGSFPVASSTVPPNVTQSSATVAIGGEPVAALPSSSSGPADAQVCQICSYAHGAPWHHAGVCLAMQHLWPGAASCAGNAGTRMTHTIMPQASVAL